MIKRWHLGIIKESVFSASRGLDISGGQVERDQWNQENFTVYRWRGRVRPQKRQAEAREKKRAETERAGHETQVSKQKPSR